MLFPNLTGSAKVLKEWPMAVIDRMCLAVVSINFLSVFIFI